MGILGSCGCQAATGIVDGAHGSAGALRRGVARAWTV